MSVTDVLSLVVFGVTWAGIEVLVYRSRGGRGK